jgi:hypothetical protein
MNVEILKQACDTLGWTYKDQDGALLIFDVKNNTNMGGEFALKISNNQVVYNTYYLPDALNKVDELKNQYYTLNVEYSKHALITEFKRKGFTYKSNSKFVENEEEKLSFFMVGRSKDKSEDEPIAQIKFTILFDGTIVTDSDYLPNDVNERAHSAMDILEQHLGNQRVMTKKEIPLKYKHKVKPRVVQNQNIKNS